MPSSAKSDELHTQSRVGERSPSGDLPSLSAHLRVLE